MSTLVEVGTIEQGKFYRKRMGSHPYVRVSPSALKYLGLGKDIVLGVSLISGTVIRDSPSLLVVPLTPAEAVEDLQKWERTFVKSV